MPRYWHIDMDEFREMWDSGAGTEEMARRFGVSRQHVVQLRHRFGLVPRDPAAGDNAPSDEDERESGDSLRFSPFVQRRIAELGLGVHRAEMPDVKPWFAVTTEPGPYADDPEDGYAYDE